jgi:Pyruvate-formate lyase-activating enzyme
LQKIKALDYKIKLDTNGTHPIVVKRLVADGLCDYVAMDIKNSRERYGVSVGIENYNTKAIEETAAFLLKNTVPYEFRTTVVDELNTIEDFKRIGKWLFGAEKYFLQTFKNSGDLIDDTLHAKKPEKMAEILQILRPCFKKVEIR